MALSAYSIRTMLFTYRIATSLLLILVYESELLDVRVTIFYKPHSDVLKAAKAKEVCLSNAEDIAEAWACLGLPGPQVCHTRRAFVHCVQR